MGYKNESYESKPQEAAPDLSLLKKDNGVKGDTVDTYLDCRIWVDKEDEGNLVPMSSVSDFNLEENMFMFLPTATFKVRDAGRFFNLDNMYYGRKLVVKILLKSKVDEEKTAEFINATFSIIDWTQLPDVQSKKYEYKVTAVWDYEQLYNSLYSFPVDGSGAKSSTDVIKTILKEQKIDVSDVDAKTNDSMCWLCCYQNLRDFIKKVVDHSYIDDNDSAFFWFDINGKAHYKSMKKIIEGKPDQHVYINNFMLNSYLKEQKQEDWEDENQTTLLYNQVYSQNIGGVINSQGGNLQVPHIYNCLSKFGDKFKKRDRKDGNAYSDKYLSVKVCQADPLLATYTNKNDDYKKFVGVSGLAETHFDDTHEYYEVAPYHNDNYRRSLFQIIWDMTIDINKQCNPIYEDIDRLPHLGQKITVKFGTTKTEKVPKYDGEYIITAIRYGVTGSSSLNARITFATDGYYDEGI